MAFVAGPEASCITGANLTVAGGTQRVIGLINNKWGRHLGRVILRTGRSAIGSANSGDGLTRNTFLQELEMGNTRILVAGASGGTAVKTLFGARSVGKGSGI